MSTENKFTITGTIVDVAKGGKFIVSLENNKSLTAECTISGKMRKNNIHLIRGDKVDVELDTSDTHKLKGRITWRYK